MRVTLGKRGTKLIIRGDDSIRPTTDKVKGAVFSSVPDRAMREAQVFIDLSESSAMGINS